MSSKINIFSGLMLGLAAGAVIGSAAALLSAPKPGKETRAILKAKSDDLVKRAEVSLEETRQRLDKAFTDARAQSSELWHLRRQKPQTQLMAQEILAE